MDDALRDGLMRGLRRFCAMAKAKSRKPLLRIPGVAIVGTAIPDPWGNYLEALGLKFHSSCICMFFLRGPKSKFSGFDRRVIDAHQEGQCVITRNGKVLRGDFVFWRYPVMVPADIQACLRKLRCFGSVSAINKTSDKNMASLFSYCSPASFSFRGARPTMLDRSGQPWIRRGGRLLSATTPSSLPARAREAGPFIDMSHGQQLEPRARKLLHGGTLLSGMDNDGDKPCGCSSALLVAFVRATSQASARI